MKKLFLLNVLLTPLLFAANVYGSIIDGASDPQEVKFGLKLKLQGSDMIYQGKDEGDTPLFRPSLDLFGEYELNDAVGLRLALGYSGQGNKTQVSGPKDKVAVYLNYVMLSAIPRFYLGSARQFSLFIGPRVGWLTSAKAQRFVSEKKQGPEVDSLKKGAPFKRINWGVIWGADYEFESGFILGTEGNLGLTSLFKGGEPEDRELIFSGGVTLGYNFAKLIR